MLCSFFALKGQKSRAIHKYMRPHNYIHTHARVHIYMYDICITEKCYINGKKFWKKCDLCHKKWYELNKIPNVLHQRSHTNLYYLMEIHPDYLYMNVEFDQSIYEQEMALRIPLTQLNFFFYYMPWMKWRNNR